ncbi:hypothetical protein QL285_030192 [Trifolium repens]|nr:hypothetical protein QL285_030192 [Trifolium repens]
MVTAQHVFLSCPNFPLLWGLIRSWVGISSADPLSIQDHFMQFSYSAGGSLDRAPSCSYFDYVTFGCCGMNGIAEFSKSKNRRSSKMLEKVNVHFIWWMKSL